MDHLEYERLRAFYKKQPDEVLLDYIQNQHSEFLPEALDLIRSELANRGIRMRDIAPAGPSPSGQFDQFEGEQGDREPLVSVAQTDSHGIALQAQDVLAQEGISSHVADPRMGGRAFPDNLPHAALQILVSAHEAEKAKTILETFPPLVLQD